MVTLLTLFLSLEDNILFDLGYGLLIPYAARYILRLLEFPSVASL